MFHYAKDSELKGYVLVLSIVALITVFTLYRSDTYGFWTSFEYGIFEVVSIATTTGYSTTGFSTWPTFLPLLLFVNQLCRRLCRFNSWWYEGDSYNADLQAGCSRITPPGSP